MLLNKFQKITIFAICICLIVGGVSFLKFYQHEKWQSGQLNSLISQTQSLQEENARLLEQIDNLQSKVEKLRVKVTYPDGAYNYLAIGNSITLHGLDDYWWNEAGMAATTADKDYVHLVVNHLKKMHNNVCYYAVNFCTWEMQAHDRAETYEVIDPYLSSKLDLITIQLSENVYDTTTFETDYESLIKYIRMKAPNADVYIIGDFWDISEKELMKVQAARNTGVPYLSLDKIKDNPKYQCGIGTIVYDGDGNKHTVEHDGVAIHPGDEGMKYIADLIIEKLKQSK